MKKVSNKELKIFVKLYKEFYDKCVEKKLVPMPTISMKPTGIFPYIDVVSISDKEREDLLKKV